MSSMNSRGNGKGAAASATGGLGSIPAASRKVVQSLKEIVNCPEGEIYAMLRECNMDPNEAVNRLLTQDPFREVKSKREKKKENKDTTEYRPRGISSTPSRGGRGGADRRTGSTQFNYSESGNTHERSAYKKENESYSHVASYSSTSLTAISDVNRHVSLSSDPAPKESKLIAASRGDGSSFQPASGFQSSWGGGTLGQVSMADIVKKGRPQNKAPGPVSSTQYGNHNHIVSAPPPLLPHHALHPPHGNMLAGSESEIGSNQRKDEWPAIEHPTTTALPSVHAVENLETTNLHLNGASQNIKSDEALLPNDGADENYSENHALSTPNTSLQEENDGDASFYESNVYENPSSYQQYGHGYEHEEAEDNSTSLSTMAANMQQVSLEKEEQVQQLKEESRSVVIPDHLQVQSSECLNLSFGSFGAGIAAGLSGTITSDPLNNDVEEQSEAEDTSPVVHSDFRNPEYYGEEQGRSESPEDLINRSSVTAEAHPPISPSQSEAPKQNIPSEAEGAQYAFHDSLPIYNFDSSHQQQLNAAYAQSQTISQTLNPAPFSNIMAYANLSPGSLLASTVQQPVRESDLSYSQFHANQLMAAKYGNQGSVGGSTASGTEALETSNISSSQQVLHGGNVAATGPSLPEHLAMHPYSQPTLPLGPFANMISYPFLPQSYTYMPSAFQQAFGGNSSYHQSLSAVLPQYKNNLSISSLPQSGAVASGYGAFGGSSTNVPGNYSLNPNASALGGSSIGYDELVSSQYKDHLLSLQQAQLQNDNSAMYAHGNGSRTMSAVPANTYYNFQGQNQQPGGFRQNQQQPSQHFGSPGYPNFYHSQSGMTMEHQQQNLRDGSLGGSQVQPSKQSQQQMWQNSY